MFLDHFQVISLKGITENALEGALLHIRSFTRNNKTTTKATQHPQTTSKYFTDHFFQVRTNLPLKRIHMMHLSFSLPSTSDSHFTPNSSILSKETKLLESMLKSTSLGVASDSFHYPPHLTLTFHLPNSSILSKETKFPDSCWKARTLRTTLPKTNRKNNKPLAQMLKSTQP